MNRIKFSPILRGGTVTADLNGQRIGYLVRDNREGLRTWVGQRIRATRWTA